MKAVNKKIQRIRLLFTLGNTGTFQLVFLLFGIPFALTIAYHIDKSRKRALKKIKIAQNNHFNTTWFRKEMKCPTISHMMNTSGTQTNINAAKFN